jgi:hypothetical protein
LTIVAKFEDYAKQLETTDALDQEIQDAAAGSEERKQEAGNIPERFKGKTPEEIAQSYVELEKLNSRQAQDLGRMRKTVDELLELELRRPADTQDAPRAKPVEAEDLYANPDETIKSVVNREVRPHVEKLEQELMQERIGRARAEFAQDYPEWEKDVHDPAFVNWIQERPYRVRLARAGDAGDFDAARDLWASYYEHRDLAKREQSKAERKQKVKEATLETSGASAPEVTETFSRAALMEKRLLAKRGNRDADFWLRSNAERIAIAYEEGRIVD